MKQLSTSEYSLGSFVSSISLTNTVTSGGASSSSGGQGGMIPPRGRTGRWWKLQSNKCDWELLLETISLNNF